MKPGYNTTDQLWDEVPDKVCYSTLDFILPTIGKIRTGIKCADCGERNKKIEIIEKFTYLKFDVLNADDFNFNKLHSNRSNRKKYDLITCFEVVEHLTNPAFFLQNVVNLLKPDGVLFLSFPGRPKWMWSNDIHFHEIDPARAKRWLFEPLGLEVIRQGKANMYYPEWHRWLGIRPMVRYYKCYTNLYELRKKKCNGVETGV